MVNDPGLHVSEEMLRAASASSTPHNHHSGVDSPLRPFDLGVMPNYHTKDGDPDIPWSAVQEARDVLYQAPDFTVERAYWLCS